MMELELALTPLQLAQCILSHEDAVSPRHTDTQRGTQDVHPGRVGQAVLNQHTKRPPHTSDVYPKPTVA